MYIVPHSPKCFPLQSKALKCESEVVFTLVQTQQNPSDLLYFIASTKNESACVVIDISYCVDFII